MGASRRTFMTPGIEFDARQTMGAATMLSKLPSGCASLAIFDPQHRSVLDNQKYGNEGARQKGRARLPSMSDGEIATIIEDLARVVRPSGHIALWIDAFVLGEAKHHGWFRHARELSRVGLFHWDKTSIGMGARFRIQSEYMILAQKPPFRAKGAFTDRGFPDTLPEAVDRARHPHAKPIGITMRLIKAVTKRGDLVIDPCAGGYGVLDACRATGRRFVGCDIAETKA